MANWKAKVDVSDIFAAFDEDNFEADRDRIVQRLRDKQEDIFRRNTLSLQDSEQFKSIVNTLSRVENNDEFNYYWNQLYDWCDIDHRVWLNVHECFAEKKEA